MYFSPSRALPVLLAVVVAGSLSGCDGGGTDANASSCVTVGPVVEILDNHLPSGGDHLLVIPVEDVIAGTERIYDIRGDNTGHAHTVTITAADFEALQDGLSVSVTSSGNGAVGASHTHDIVISCP